MSNKTQLQTNNTTLDALITRVNTAKDTAASLPEAGGGSGGSVETCTVIVDFRPPGAGEVLYQSSPGTYLAQYLYSGDIVSLTAIQGSFVYAYAQDPIYAYTQGAELIYGNLFLLTVGSGETATIQLFTAGGTNPA